MDRWQEKASNSPQCRHKNPPSFSSTLLDSIYRSIDDERRTAGARAPNPFPTRTLPPLNPPEITRSIRNHRTKTTHPTSSSSDNSSYGGFSSSESEPSKSKKERFTAIRNRLLRELRKGRGRDPVSPASRLANFLNSLFAAKSKASRNADEPCSRSCMSKTASGRGKTGPEKRSVRFYPAVDEDCRKRVYGEERPAAAAHRRIAVEEEEWEAGSDSSSDLFELENLAFAVRFRDELPVYETTRLGSYGGVSGGLVF